METTILAAAVALVSLLPAVLTVLPLPLPTPLQDAQEIPCAIENDGDPPEGVIVDENDKCEFIGNDMDFEED
jgi:hypothetical protein